MINSRYPSGCAVRPNSQQPLLSPLSLRFYCTFILISLHLSVGPPAGMVPSLHGHAALRTPSRHAVTMVTAAPLPPQIRSPNATYFQSDIKICCSTYLMCMCRMQTIQKATWMLITWHFTIIYRIKITFHLNLYPFRWVWFLWQSLVWFDSV